MKLKCPPPTNRNLNFRCYNHTFTWNETEESFEAWLEKIQRYGRDNKLPEYQWSEQSVLSSLQTQLGADAGQFIEPDLPTPDVSLDFKATSLEPPQSLALAAKLAFPRLPVLAVASGVLSVLKSHQWARVIRFWKEQNPTASREDAGRVWWFILHTLANNCADETADVGSWVNLWHERFPCRACVNHFRQCPVAPPSGWADLARYADEAHDWVTANK